MHSICCHRTWQFEEVNFETLMKLAIEVFAFTRSNFNVGIFFFKSLYLFLYWILGNMRWWKAFIYTNSSQDKVTGRTRAVSMLPWNADNPSSFQRLFWVKLLINAVFMRIRDFQSKICNNIGIFLLCLFHCTCLLQLKNEENIYYPLATKAVVWIIVEANQNEMIVNIWIKFY